MTATFTSPVQYNYAPTARYVAPNRYAPVRQQAQRGPGIQSVPRPQVPQPVRHVRQQPVRQQPWVPTPYTPLQDASAGYLYRPGLRTAIPMPVIILLSAVVFTIAIAVAWAAV